MQLTRIRPLSVLITRRLLLQSNLCQNNAIILNIGYRQPVVTISEDVRRKIKIKTGLIRDEKEEALNSFEEELKKLTLVQRYKKMFLEYWYIVLPVAGVTSIIWFGSFYLIGQSVGTEVLVSLAEKIGVSDRFTAQLKGGGLGSFAIALILYKVFAPLRYMVTIYGTIKTIRFCVRRGLIKPLPSKEKLKDMIQKKVKTSREAINKRRPPGR